MGERSDSDVGAGVGTPENLNGLFPLTPALSPGEREKRLAPFCRWWHRLYLNLNARSAVTKPPISESPQRLRGVLPLPKGEGRGEGEGKPRRRPSSALGHDSPWVCLIRLTHFQSHPQQGIEYNPIDNCYSVLQILA